MKANKREFGSKVDGVEYIDRPGAYALVQDDAGLIAVIETGRGWFLPGGGLDAGERAAEALQREVLEETGYEVSVMAEIGAVVEYVFAEVEQAHYRICGRLFRARLGAKITEPTEPDHRLVWLARGDALGRLTRPSQAWAVELASQTAGEQRRQAASGELAEYTDRHSSESVVGRAFTK